MAALAARRAAPANLQVLRPSARPGSSTPIRHLQTGGGLAFFNHVADDVDWTVQGTHPLAGHYRGKAAFLAGTFVKLARVLRDDAQLAVVNVMVSGDWAIVELRADATAKNGMRFDNSYCWLARFHTQDRQVRPSTPLRALFASQLAYSISCPSPCVMLLPHFGFNRFRRDASPHRRRATALIDRHVAAVSTQERGCSVKFHLLFAAAAAATLASPIAAQAQGIPDGIAHGTYVGGTTAGPVGAVVGGAVGGVIGGVEGLFGVRPVYAAYPEPRMYHHRPWARHTYRHRRHTTG